jgi:hypothetical protein
VSLLFGLNKNGNDKFVQVKRVLEPEQFRYVVNYAFRTEVLFISDS